MKFNLKKKILIFSSIFMLICTIAVVASTIVSNKYTSSEHNSTEDTPTHIYTVKEYSGRIAVFKRDDSEPIRIIDVYTSTLPEEDVEKLRQGINIGSDAELQQVIEDFSS